MNKHLNRISKVVYVLIAAVAFEGCSKQSPQKDFVARVNDSYLTKSELNDMMRSGGGSSFYRSEVIRNWINKQILYQEAVRKGILKNEGFQKMMEDSKKELAASMLLQKYYEDEKTNYEPQEVEDYYNRHINDFKMPYESYLVNLISFKDEDKAVRFRSTVLESDWEKALNVFKGDTTIIRVLSGALLYSYEIHPVALSRIVTALNPDELSIVIAEQPGRFTIVQEVQKFDRDAAIPFNAIKPLVEGRFVAEKKENLIRDYIKDLYSNNDIEVRN